MGWLQFSNQSEDLRAENKDVSTSKDKYLLSGNGDSYIEPVKPSFLPRETEAKREEIKLEKKKSNSMLKKRKDPNKRYKRILKRVKYDHRDSVSSHSSLESDYRTIADGIDTVNDEDEAELPLMEIAEKDELSDRENSKEFTAGLPRNMEQKSLNDH